MITTTEMLLEQFNQYSDPHGKIRRMVRDGKLIPVVRGIYETDPAAAGYLLAPVIYGPSYLSFSYALSRHGLIPERVRSYTSATCNKNRRKVYTNAFGTYTYRDIPADAYPYEVELVEEGGRYYWIAGAEKALCDRLYELPPVRNQKELQELLFEDLRIDEKGFANLNAGIIQTLSGKYRCSNIRQLSVYLRRLK